MNPFWREAKRRWYLPYLDESGKQCQHVIPPKIAPTRSKADERAAREYAKRWLEDREKSGGAQPAPKAEAGPTVRDLWERWINLRREEVRDGKPRYAPSTIGDNALHLKSRILPAFGDTSIAALDPQELRRWVRALAAETSAQYTRNVVSTFKSIVDAAMGEGWVSAAALAANPLEHPTVLQVLPPARRQSGSRPIFIELVDAQKLVTSSEVKPHRRVRYLVDLCTGLSEGELAGRIWSDVDLGERPVLRVHNALQARGAEGWGTIGPTKNEHRVRTIPLHSAAAEALRWWRDAGWGERVGRAPRLSDPIFPSAKGTFSRPASAVYLRQDLRAAGCSDRCFGHPITTQALRRCFATYLDAAGVHDEQRMRLMGHAPATVNAKHYTAAQVETDRAAVELIALSWAPVPESVPVPVPAAQDPQNRRATFEIRTRDLRFTKPSLQSGSCAATGACGRLAPREPLDSDGIEDADGHSDVPESLRACADGLSGLRSIWDAFDAFVGPSDAEHAGGGR